MTKERPDRLRITGTAGMRALAHPARLASIEHLMRVGPSTATELGELVGLTASAMSYHLRALERAGLIQNAESRGDGRERLWQSTHAGTGFDVLTTDDDSDEARAASKQLLEAAVSIDEVETRRWLARSAQPGWADYGHLMTATVLLSQDELVEVGEKLSALLDPYRKRTRQGSGPEDAVEMRAYFKCFPTG
jgi:DNA-binding transcriptional ArsR family regulator